MPGQKIKIALVIESLGFGGREKVLLQVANGLNPQRYEVHVIVFSNDNNQQSVALNKDVQLHAFPFKNKNLITPSNIFLSPLIVIKFIKVLQKIKPDITHTHFLYQLLFLAAVSIRLSRIKTLHFHTIHTAGLYYTEKSSKNKFTLKTETLSVNINHAYLITVSKQLEQIALDLFKGKASDIKYIINGVDDKKFNFHLRSQCKKTSFGFTDNEIIVSYVARFDAAQKDHLTLLKAWQLVVKKVPDARLCLAGDGAAKNQAEQFVEQNKLRNTVCFPGNITNVNELLAITDVGVFTSRYEGLSVALLEKMFMKLPVVATNIPTFSTIINDGASGYLFAPGDYKALTEKLVLLLSDKNLRCTMGNHAYDSVKEYTLNAMVKKHDEYYEAVLSHKGLR